MEGTRRFYADLHARRATADFRQRPRGATQETGTLYLVQRVGRAMRERGQGRILITGSIAGFQSGAFQAVYNGTKAFIDSFAMALRNELKATSRSAHAPS